MAEPSAGEGGPFVVLLHGLGRTRLAMVPLASFLRRRGMIPINVGYFSPAGLEASVGRLQRVLDLRLATGPDRPVHFVTHSMGGIVARAYLAARQVPTPVGTPVGRMVQLAPPNQGAALADVVRRVPLLGRVPAFSELGAESPRNAIPGTAPLDGYEVGVIAGQSFGPWHKEHASDGVVRVSETWLPEAKDWILLRHFHTLVMNGRDTWDNVASFLETGRFLAEASRLERDSSGAVRVQGEVDPA